MNKNEFINIKHNILQYFKANILFIEYLYSRKTDLKYSEIIRKVNKSISLIEIQTEVSSFYNIRIKKEHLTEMLFLVDKLEVCDITENKKIIFEEYLKKFSKISGRNEISYTSKLLNLKYRDFPIYDSRVEKFLNLIGYKNNSVEAIDRYFELLDFYDYVYNDKELYNLIREIRYSIYKEFKIKEINLTKFIDTLFYSISDGEELKRLIILVRGQ